MTPEERFNKNIWWTLQAIKGEILSTPVGEIVEADTDHLIHNSDTIDLGAPRTNDISKCIRKLEELGAFKVIEMNDQDSFDPYYQAFPNWNNANFFKLAINQKKFDTLVTEYQALVSKVSAGTQTLPSASITKTRFSIIVKEKIARVIAEYFTTNQIVNVFTDANISANKSLYAKWRITLDAFGKMSEPEESIPHILGVFCHPLNFEDPQVRTELIKKLNAILIYGNLKLKPTDRTTEVVFSDGTPIGSSVYTRKTKTFSSANADDFYPPSVECDSDQAEYEASMLRKPKSAEHFAIIRAAYKTLMAIVSSFCSDPAAPSPKLNTAYAELSGIVTRTLGSFCGDTSEFEVFSFDEYKKNNFGIPFSTLYSAELEFKNKGRKMHWNEIRPEMNAVLGQIEEVYKTANEPDVISEPKIQETINEAMLILSQIAAERKDAISDDAGQTVKMEITKLPDLNVRNVEDGTIAKGRKRIYPPKFKETEWEKITIRFLDEQNVLITAGKKEVVPANYEALGFADEKRDKPNMAWAFFYGLAKNNGETEQLSTPIPDNIKQQKRQISDRLKTIFKNDTDPFHDPTDTRVYKIKINLVPPQSVDEKGDKLGVQEYLKETITEEYEYGG